MAIRDELMNRDGCMEAAIYDEDELGDARTNRKYRILPDMLSMCYIYTVYKFANIEWIKYIYVATVCTT